MRFLLFSRMTLRVSHAGKSWILLSEHALSMWPPPSFLSFKYCCFWILIISCGFIYLLIFSLYWELVYTSSTSGQTCIFHGPRLPLSSFTSCFCEEPFLALFAVSNSSFWLLLVLSSTSSKSILESLHLPSIRICTWFELGNISLKNVFFAPHNCTWQTTCWRE